METQLLPSCGQERVRAQGPYSLCSGEMGSWGAQHPLGLTTHLSAPYRAHPPALLHGHLGLLQPVVETPEVLGEELGAYGLPVDADPLTHLHQVGRAARRPGVIGTLSSAHPLAFS